MAARGAGVDRHAPGLLRAREVPAQRAKVSAIRDRAEKRDEQSGACQTIGSCLEAGTLPDAERVKLVDGLDDTSPRVTQTSPRTADDVDQNALSALARMEGEVRLRQGYGGQPSRGLPTVAYATLASVSEAAD